MKMTRFFAIIFFAGIIMFSGCVENTNINSLIEDLDHENESVRFDTMNVLVDISDEKTIGLLVQAVQNKNNTIEMRKNAITTLGRIGESSTTNLLLNISMNESENKHLRMASILALGDIGNKDAIYSLKGLGYSEDGLILYHAAYVINQLNESYPLYDTYFVYGTYGKLPYPSTEDQRNFRNNAFEISQSVPYDHLVELEDSYILVDYSPKSGFIEVKTSEQPNSTVMDELYEQYSTEAERRNVSELPLRFVHIEPFVFTCV
ncbi:HEAT repeat domain-containing protein [Methanococcoides sp. SA1]|nr:HEAT repeat domain-containing protein [Methanococcoides sp. SA1]